MTERRIPTGEPDPGVAAPGERFEAQHLAQRHGISTSEAIELIERFGLDREVLDREAEKLRSR